MTGSLTWTSIKLTLFTAVTIVVTIWLASVIGNFALLASPYEVEAEFSDASGLLRGDVVKAAGVTVGRVDKIELVNGLALVTMAIDEGAELPRDLRAEVRFRNLIGQRMIELVPGPAATSAMLGDGDRILLEDTSPAFDLTVLFNGLRPLIRSTDPADINAVTQAVTRALAGRADDVEGILSNLASVSDVLSSRDTELGELLDGLNVVTADLAGRDAQLQGTLADINSFLADVSASRDDLSAALLTLDDAAGRFRRILARNDTNIEVELEDLATILDAVDDKRADLRGAVRALPGMLQGVERVTQYGQWSNLHVIHLCKEDLGTCGHRGGR
ncbi:MAG TPA: MCE family protein [Actinomycetota bacterium]|nr:MCE family protein [Actinomycetota bacterium]